MIDATELNLIVLHGTCRLNYVHSFTNAKSRNSVFICRCAYVSYNA